MPYTPRRLFGPSSIGVLPATTLMAVPANTIDILKQIVAANTSDSPVRLTTSLVPSGGTSGPINRLIPGSVIQPRSVVTFDLSQVLNAGDFLTSFVATANLLSVNDASFETSVAGYTARANAAIERSTAQAAHGVASMRISSTTTSTVSLSA